MFAYCLNNPVMLADYTGTESIVARIILFFLAHQAVQKTCKELLHCETEVYVIDSLGYAGRLDLYNPCTNEFYEVKSEGAAIFSSKQIGRYCSSRIKSNKDSCKGCNGRTPIMGTGYVKGTTECCGYTVEFETSKKMSCLIEYKIIIPDEAQPQEALVPQREKKRNPNPSFCVGGFGFAVAPSNGNRGGVMSWGWNYVDFGMKGRGMEGMLYSAFD